MHKHILNSIHVNIEEALTKHGYCSIRSFMKILNNLTIISYTQLKLTQKMWGKKTLK